MNQCTFWTIICTFWTNIKDFFKYLTVAKEDTDWESFGAKYQLLDGLAKPNMAVIVEHENKVVGFVFMIEDLLCSNQKRFVFKTDAVHPEVKYSGLGAVNPQRLIQELMEQG